MSKSVTIQGNTYANVPALRMKVGNGYSLFYDCDGVLSVTENGEHDCAGYSSVYVDVEGGSSDIPFAFGGLNATKIAEYSETFTLADTSFVIGESASTSSVTLKASVSNKYVSGTLSIGDKDIVVVQTLAVTPTHGSTATNKAKQLKYAFAHVTTLAKRKTSDTSSNTTRQSFTQTNYLVKYYNTSGTITRSQGNYGFYGTPQPASVASTTAASTTVRASSPILMYRASSSYESTTNIKLVTECEWVWNVDVYLVDSQSSPASGINNCVDAILCG